MRDAVLLLFTPNDSPMSCKFPVNLQVPLENRIQIVYSTCYITVCIYFRMYTHQMDSNRHTFWVTLPLPRRKKSPANQIQFV